MGTGGIGLKFVKTLYSEHFITYFFSQNHHPKEWPCYTYSSTNQVDRTGHPFHYYAPHLQTVPLTRITACREAWQPFSMVVIKTTKACGWQNRYAYIELLVFEMPVHRLQYAHDSIATKHCVKSAHTRFYCIPCDPDLWKPSWQPCY